MFFQEFGSSSGELFTSYRAFWIFQQEPNYSDNRKKRVVLCEQVNSGETRNSPQRGPSCLYHKYCVTYGTDHSEKLQTHQAFMPCIYSITWSLFS